jgi:hypothetical protein
MQGPGSDPRTAEKEAAFFPKPDVLLTSIHSRTHLLPGVFGGGKPPWDSRLLMGLLSRKEPTSKGAEDTKGHSAQLRCPAPLQLQTEALWMQSGP